MITGLTLKKEKAMLKKYIQPQTDTVKVQAQEILAGSDQTFKVLPSDGEDPKIITKDDMESKFNHYDVWED